jgi:hypothetical protein
MMGHQARAHQVSVFVTMAATHGPRKKQNGDRNEEEDDEDAGGAA